MNTIYISTPPWKRRAGIYTEKSRYGRGRAYTQRSQDTAWAGISEADIGGGGAKTIEKHSSIKKRFNSIAEIIMRKQDRVTMISLVPANCYPCKASCDWLE